jgi:cathepsin X
MRKTAVCTLALLFGATIALDPSPPCDRTTEIPAHAIHRVRAYEKIDLPKTFEWNNVNNTNYLTNVRNQHLPTWCGSCWAHAATSAFSDRIKIQRKAAWPDINIAPQVLISCLKNTDNEGCNGGNHYDAHQYIT